MPFPVLEKAYAMKNLIKSMENLDSVRFRCDKTEKRKLDQGSKEKGESAKKLMKPIENYGN